MLWNGRFQKSAGAARENGHSKSGWQHLDRRRANRRAFRHEQLGSERLQSCRAKQFRTKCGPLRVVTTRQTLPRRNRTLVPRSILRLLPKWPDSVKLWLERSSPPSLRCQRLHKTGRRQCSESKFAGSANAGRLACATMCGANMASNAGRGHSCLITSARKPCRCRRSLKLSHRRVTQHRQAIAVQRYLNSVRQFGQGWQILRRPCHNRRPVPCKSLGKHGIVIRNYDHSRSQLRHIEPRLHRGDAGSEYTPVAVPTAAVLLFAPPQHYLVLRSSPLLREAPPEPVARRQSACTFSRICRSNFRTAAAGALHIDMRNRVKQNESIGRGDHRRRDMRVQVECGDIVARWGPIDLAITACRISPFHIGMIFASKRTVQRQQALHPPARPHAGCQRIPA